jgi:hypothetical protein
MLLPELVPAPLWGLSVYQLSRKGAIPRRLWATIRAATFAAAERRCAACGDRPEKFMVCDEVWNYDDPRRVAKLVGFQPLCPMCNFVKHIGRAGQVRPTQDDLIEHMARVNRMDVKLALQMVVDASSEWSTRSEHRWRVVVDPVLLARYPALSALDGLASTPKEGRSRVRAWERRRRT